MRRKLTLSILFVIILLAVGSTADEPQKRVMKFIAVIDIQCGEGVKKNLSAPLTNVIIDELVKIGTYTVIDRANRDKILSEQGFQQTCQVGECVVEMGRLLGVGKIVVGRIDKLGDSYLISLQIINVQTASIEASARESCQCDESGLPTAVANATKKLFGQSHAVIPPPAPSLPEAQNETSTTPLEGEWLYYESSKGYGTWHGIWKFTGKSGMYIYQDHYNKKRQDPLEIITCSTENFTITRNYLGKIYTYSGIFKQNGLVFESTDMNVLPRVQGVKNTRSETSIDGDWKLTEKSKWGTSTAVFGISGGKGKGVWVFKGKSYVNELVVVPRLNQAEVTIFRDDPTYLDTCTYWGKVAETSKNVSGTFQCTFWKKEIGTFEMNR